MAPNRQTANEVQARLEMLEEHNKEFRENTRTDLTKIFGKLEEIHGDMTVMKGLPAEVSIQRAALENMNHRLGILEADKATVIGAKTIFFTVCGFVGWLILCIIQYSKGSNHLGISDYH
jgi:hypothetical protein